MKRRMNVSLMVGVLLIVGLLAACSGKKTPETEAPAPGSKSETEAVAEIATEAVTCAAEEAVEAATEVETESVTESATEEILIPMDVAEEAAPAEVGADEEADFG